ncbi:MOSC domain-containing protein [Reichenbachiella versicolor]|uniref:MOSC domain-containing protein n=1 Tax=Reichenbachiella versicolor TaxID=1821036 RepID=UPI000D6DCC1B|nr:MOSC domain-containing protein [Reichenbachiella versicolor]
MKIVSTNVGQKREVIWRGKPVQTGIFKESVEEGIYLGSSDVKGDHVIDRKYHGGYDKACYLYSAGHYTHWKELYPEKELPFGMFGENLTVEGLDETEITIGSTYRIGGALVQVSEPREPCFKLGIRFDDQGVLKHFLNSTYSGVYVRVLEEGEVKAGDKMELVEYVDGISIVDVYKMLYASSIDEDTLLQLAEDVHLNEEKRERLLEKFGAK